MGITTRPDAPGPYAPPAPGDQPPDAVVFIPSLFPAVVRTADDAARRIAAALDRNAATRAAQFFAAEGRDESYASGAAGSGASSAPSDARRKATRVVSVMRRDAEGAPAVCVLDVYDFQYVTSLTGAFTSRLPFLQALSVAGVLVGNFGRLLRSVRARSKDWAHKLQVTWGGALFLLMFVYMAYLVVTALASVWGGWDQFTGQAAPKRWLSMMQSSASVLVALGLFSRANLKALVAKVAAETACAANYVSAGASQKTILGELARLLEHIAEKGVGEGVAYRRVHVVSFSFGTVVALDALFQDGDPAPAFGAVDSLVTIGCPFDFVRTYYPRYFDERRAAGRPVGACRWLNFYAPADVFGSDFMDYGPDGSRKPRGIGLAGGGECVPESLVFGPARGLDEYGLAAMLALTGFKVHASYWDPDPDGLTCFDPVVRELLAGTAAMR